MPNSPNFTLFLFLGLVLWGVFPNISFAQPSKDKSPGFHGTLGLGVGQLQTTSLSQFRIFTYDDSPETLRKIVPLPTLNFSYVDDSGNWSFGLPQGKLGISREQITDIGTIKFGLGFGIFNNLNEFKNPYLLGTHRDKTSTTEQIQELSYRLGEGLALELGVKREEKLFRDDDTPDVDPDLGRDAVTENWSLGLNLFFVKIQLGQVQTNAEGEADSSTGSQNGLFVFVPLGESLLVIVSTSQTKTVFNTSHPVFGKTREDLNYNTFARIQFNDEPYQYYLMGFSNLLNSNIDFFDSTSQLIGLGINYSF